MLSSKRTSKDKEGDSLLQNGRLDKDTSQLPSNSKKTSSTNINHIYPNDKPSNVHSINQSSIAGKGEGESNDSCKDRLSRPQTNDLSASNKSKGLKSITPDGLTAGLSPGVNNNFGNPNYDQLQNKNLELDAENSDNEKQQVGPSNGNPDDLQPNEANLDKDGKQNDCDKNKASEDTKLDENQDDPSKLENNKNDKNSLNNSDSHINERSKDRSQNDNQLDNENNSNKKLDSNVDDANSNPNEQDKDNTEKLIEKDGKNKNEEEKTDNEFDLQNKPNMQDPETMQEDDINSKDKQSNSENHEGKSNQESEEEEESKEGDDHETDSQGEGDDDSENQDNVPDGENSFYPRKKKHNPSSHHDYSEIDFSGDEVFELPSNSESFKAGTIFRAGNSCFHDNIKEADLGQIIFRARLMVKQRELSIKNRKPNPTNIQKKLVHDEDYYPLNPEHSRRRLQKIVRKACKKKMRAQIVHSINEGLDKSIAE